MECINKRTAPGGRNTESAADEGYLYNLFEQTKNSTTLQNCQSVEGLLPRGKENRISTAELVAMTGAGSPRLLQKMIEAERENGALILSHVTGGYYLPAEGEAGQREIAEYVRTLRSRALNTLKILRTANRALKQDNKQRSLFDD